MDKTKIAAALALLTLCGGAIGYLRVLEEMRQTTERYTRFIQDEQGWE